MVNNNNNNVTMTTTNNNNYYNIIDKTNLKEIESVGFQNFYNSLSFSLKNICDLLFSILAPSPSHLDYL